MRKILRLNLLMLVLVSWSLLAAERQPVEKIEFVGLERINQETALSYVSVTKGQVLTDVQVRSLIKSLFATGFFRDIQVFQEGGVLRIAVVERPSIAEIRLEGSKLIKETELLQAIEVLGIKKGRILNETDLDRIAQDIRQRYQNQGYYATLVEPQLEQLPRNRVNLTIRVQEGEAARIAKITLVGNKAFDEKRLVGLMSLSEPTMWSWFSDADQYARTKLQADLETLRSFYMDRGYADFRILSSQVSLSADKTRVYVTINMEEGRQYTVEAVDFMGQTVVGEAELRQLLTFKPGEPFARNQIIESVNAIKDRLSEQGYAFAEVEPKPTLDSSKGLVRLTFSVEPKNRVYVRRIEIVGNNRTRDYVIRRELRQFEAAPYNLAAVRQSQKRLKRLGFFQKVDIQTQPVAADQVDLVVTVEEMPTGSITASIGYSQVENLLLGFSLSERNFLGTGNQAEFRINHSNARKFYDINITNPYFTPEGHSLTMGFFRREIDAAYLYLAPYSTNTIGARISYGIPLSEDERVSFGVQVERLSLVFQTDFGNRLQEAAANQGYVDVNGVSKPFSDQSLVSQYATLFGSGQEYNDISLQARYIHDSRDEFYFPTSGHYHSSGITLSTPAGDLPYYQVDVQHRYYVPLGKTTSLSLSVELGYGDGYDKLSGLGLPFFRRYYAGGIKSVRGYEAFSLGGSYDYDTDKTTRAIGGDFMTLASAALNFKPWFIEDSTNMRLSWFVDAGNVFKKYDDFKADELRLSTGLGFSWITAIGPLTFSYAKPLNERTGDRVQEFQFTIGVPF